MAPSRLIIIFVIFVIFVLLLGISRNYNVSGQTITVIDDLNDFSKTYSHTGTFSFDGSSSGNFGGDTSRLARAVASTSPPASIVYNHSSIESFIVMTYFWPGESINHFAFYSSQDGSNWTSISPNISNEGGNWTRVVYSGLLPPQANFLKVEFPSSGIPWTPQVSRVMLNVAPSLQTIMVTDNLNDFSKTYSHTGTFSFDGSSSSYFRGDTSRLARTVASTSPPSSIVYNHSSIESFIVTTYFWPGESINHFAFYSSQDGSNWTSISPNISNEGGNWTRVVYSGLLPPQANFLKVEFPSSGIPWTPQVSRVMLNVAPSLPSPSTNLSMALIDPINSIGGAPGKDLRSRNCNWSLPLLGLPGRAGMDLGLTLSLNSLVYTRAGSVMHFDPLQGYPAPGFSLGFPEIHNSFTNTDAGVQSYLLSMPSGSRVEFRQINTNVYEAVDSSYMRLTHDPVNSVFILYTTDGTQFRFEDVTGLGDYKCKQIKDRQGNYITITYGSLAEIRTITDALGRVVNFNYDTFNHLISITQNWGGQTHTWATFAYGTQTIQTNFPGLTLNGTTNGAHESVLQRVGLADGTVYSFEYNTYAQVKTIRKNAPKNSNPINFPGDYVERAYTTYGLPSNANDPQTDCPRATSRTDGAYDWHSDVKHFYAGGLNHGWGKVTFPDGTIYKEFFATTGWQRGLTTRTEHLSGGVVKKSTELEWTQDNTGVSYRLNPRVTQTIVSDDANNFLWTTIGYTSFGLVSDVHEYGSGTTPLRRKHIDYNLSAVYTDRRIIGLPSAVYLYDGNNTLFSKIKYEYDQNPNLYLQHPGPTVQHDTANYGLGFGQGRGNLNIVTRWNVDDPNNASQVSETETGYNTSGSVIFTRDPLNHQTTVTYDDSFSDGQNRNTFAYPTTMTNADNFSSSVQYAYHSGAVTRTQDPKGAAVARTYDAAGRIARITNEVNGAYTRYAYTTDQHFVLSLTTVNDFSEFIQVKGFDGHDRLRVTVSDHPTSVGQSKAQFNAYDEMGRLVGQTNPIEVDSAWQPAGDDAAAGWVGTSQAYNWQGLPTVTTNQDGTTKEVLYGGCGCAGGQVVVTRDEMGRREKMTYDILGRLKTTQKLFIQPKNEPLDGNGAVYSTTTNTCNVRDQVTNVNVKDEASGVSQNTQMVYDGHGRLKERWLPIYLGNPQSATPYDSYEYNSDDTLMRVTDPRGASATYSYNDRRLVTSVVYAAPGGVAATPIVNFAYDEAGNRTWMDDGPGYVNYVYDTLSRLQSETRHFDDLTGGYQISFTYNLAGQIKTITDNRFNTTATYTYNKAGQMTGIAGNGYGGSAQNNFTASSASIWYRAWGGTKQLGYANGLQLNLSYNERLQPTQYRLRNEQSIIRDGSDYQYYDDGRVKFASNLVATNELITPANAFDRAYNYDHVGRLAEASTGPEARGEVLPPSPPPPNNPYRQVNTYDVWGNLIGRANRFWRTLPYDTATHLNNRRGGWQYDQAGNALRDSNEHTYDAIGRQVTMTGGGVGGGLTGHPNMPSTEIAQNYDGDGSLAKRIETRRTEELIDGGPQTEITTSVTTTYYVRPRALGGQVMLELSAAGNKNKSYVYAGNERIAEDYNVFEGGQYYIAWRHSNPVTGTMLKSYDSTEPFSEIHDRSEFDPFGAEVGNTDPYYGDEYADYVEIKGQEPLYMEGGDPFDLSGGCELDGMPISCSEFTRRVEAGAVQAVGPGGAGDVIHLGRGVFYGKYGKERIKNENREPGDLEWNIKYQDFFGSVAFGPQAQQQSEYPPKAPFPPRDQLREGLKTLLGTGDCGKYVNNLLSKVAELTGNPSHSTDALDLFDKIKDFKLENIQTKIGDLEIGGGVRGSIANKDAEVFLKPLIGTRLSSRIMYIYTQGSLHEMLHHAGVKKYYTDAELARAGVALGLDDASTEYLKGRDITKNPGATRFFDHLLHKHCPGLVDNGVQKTLPVK